MWVVSVLLRLGSAVPLRHLPDLPQHQKDLRLPRLASHHLLPRPPALHLHLLLNLQMNYLCRTALQANTLPPKTRCRALFGSRLNPGLNLKGILFLHHRQPLVHHL